MGIRKNKFVHNKRGESLRSILNTKIKKGYRIFKIKHNFKNISKMKKLVKITMAFTSKTICTIILLIIIFPEIFKCSTK